MNPLRLISAIFLLAAYPGFAQNEVSFAKEFTIHSSLLQEERKYFIRLPVSYENDNMYVKKRYPVLIILDADSHFFHVCGLVHSLSVNDEVIPEMIIVGIRNTDRSRDMTPAEVDGRPQSANAFVTFIENELIKEIDEKYRTQPYRILAGHSLAGLFTIDCFLSKRPFNAYIAIDPSLRWENEAIVKKAQLVFSSPHTFHSIIYTAQAKNPFDTNAVDQKDLAFRKFQNAIDTTAVIYKNKVFKSEDHYSIPSIAFYDGLRFVFHGFKIPLEKDSFRTSTAITKYYAQFQKKMGGAISLPGKYINQVATFLLNEKRIDHALELMKVNEIHYPNSSVTHQSPGDAFRAKGDDTMASKHYKRALELDPKNEKVKSCYWNYIRFIHKRCFHLTQRGLPRNSDRMLASFMNLSFFPPKFKTFTLDASSKTRFNS